MALIGFDSGEATRYPTYASVNTLGIWTKVANQPTAWQIISNSANCLQGFQTTTIYSGTTAARVHNEGQFVGMRRSWSDTTFSESFLCFMYNTNSAYAKDIFILTTALAAISVRIAIDASYRILVYAGTGAGTLKATITTGWSGNSWHSVQLHVNTATNTLEIKLDNGDLTDCSGTAMAAWYYLAIGTPVNVATTNGDSYYDCITVHDATGAINNTWPGSPQIATAQRPNADTAVTDWTRLSGSNDYDMIKEVSPDLDTTYVYSQLDGDTSTYGISALTPPASSVIVGVCLTAVAKRADAAYLIPVVSRGGSTPDLTALKKAIGLDYMAPIEWFLETDPITGLAWTTANLNATYFGFKHSV